MLGMCNLSALYAALLVDLSESKCPPVPIRAIKSKRTIGAYTAIFLVMGYGACPMFKRSPWPWHPPQCRRQMGLPAHTLPIFIFPGGGMGAVPPCSPKALALSFPYFSIAKKSARAARLPARIEHPLPRVMGLPSIWVQAPPASETMMLAAA